MSVRVAIYFPSIKARTVMEIDPANIPGAEEDLDGAMRFADWAREQEGVAGVKRQDTKVLVTMKV